MENESSAPKIRYFFWRFYSPYKTSIIFFIALNIFLGLPGLVNSYLTKVIIDNLSELQNSTLVFEKAFWPALLLVLSFQIYSLCWRAINYIHLISLPVIKNSVINHMFNYILNQSHRFFQDNLSGSIASHINILSDNMEKIGGVILGRIIRGAAQLITALVAMYFVHPVFSLSLLIWAIAFISISFRVSKKVRAISDNYAKSQTQVSGKIVDSVSNFSAVKVFSQLNFESMHLGNFLDLMKKKFQEKCWFLIKFYFFQGLSITCLMAVMVFLLIHFHIHAQVTIGDFAFILGLSFYITENVWMVTEQIDELNDAVGKCNQSLKALIKPIEIKDKFDAKPLVVTQGKIVFENVKFHYRDEETLFQNKSVIIEPGQKVGLVGYSGSGKSTFLNLILRLFDVKSGRILIDEQDIRDVTQSSLHSAIGIIPQDPSLFHRSILENIRYGFLEATRDDVINAAKKARIHEFICTLPEKYDSLVGERGVKLSGGQRQRIAMARVFLKDSPILILDEATSHLDSITENAIQDSLGELIQGKTTLVIAHRLSTLFDMDRILVFDRGKIVEDGSHRELLNNGGLYQKMWYAQMGEFINKEGINGF